MKIFAIGMNYTEHNKALHGSSNRPEEPVIFTKADTALLKDGKPFFIPDDMGRIEYETELVVRICKLGKTIPERFAHRYYDEMTVGIDFTARDLQAEMKSIGMPWEIAKSFDNSAAIGTFVDKNELFAGKDSLQFGLFLNSQQVQSGVTSDMIHTIDEIIEHASKFFTLKIGDLIFTGTPSGVGPVKIGDRLEGYINGRKLLDFYVR